jgi:tetratricopeptide (TPR) repeat protein
MSSPAKAIPLVPTCVLRRMLYRLEGARKHFFLGALTLLSLAVPRVCLGDEPSALSVADASFFAIDYPSAVTAYDVLLRTSPEDPQILWRLARVHVCLAEVQDDAQRKTLCQVAEGYARRCIQADSTLAEGHTWLAAALGYIALGEGAHRQVEISKEILTETGLALQLNPRDDAALSIRGSVFRALGNVSWVKRQVASLLFGGMPSGGYDEGETALLQAIALGPDVMRHSYELGVLYLDWGKQDEARGVLERALTMPIRVAIDRPRREKIKLFLLRLG